jgi:hypothetical protein
LKAKPNLKVHMAWVPGHMGVDGNKVADREAKEAAKGPLSALQRPRKALSQLLPKSVAAIKAAVKKDSTRRWIKRWKASQRAKLASKYDNRPPDTHVLRIYKDLSRQEASILTQLRTGHIGLNAFRYRIGQVDSPNCTHCNVPETVTHYLLTCRRFIDQRHTLKNTLKRKLSLINLIGHKPPTTQLLEFINATSRFPSTDRSMT